MWSSLLIFMLFAAALVMTLWCAGTMVRRLDQPPAAAPTDGAVAATKPPAVPNEIAAPVADPGADPIEQLARLAKLRDAGALTVAEFDSKKAELLKRL